MNYNDFPILNNDEYKILSEQYSSLISFDRKTLLYNLCNELTSCIGYCTGLSNEFNSKIRYEIQESRTILNKILNNIASTFNIECNSQIVTNFNLFTFLNKLVNITILFNSWISNEQKDYYKTMANKSTIELLNCIKKIITALENSNLHFFRHM